MKRHNLNALIQPDVFASFPNNLRFFGCFSAVEPVPQKSSLTMDFEESGLTGSEIAHHMNERDWLLVIDRVEVVGFNEADNTDFRALKDRVETRRRRVTLPKKP